MNKLYSVQVILYTTKSLLQKLINNVYLGAEKGKIKHLNS
jgi:hypothetical protein